MSSPNSLRVGFVHPDLGIGGAERLVVDAAVGLQTEGHNVVIYTSHHDLSHSFEETRDGTLTIRVRGNTLFPRTIFGSLYIMCAILRQIHLTLSLIFWDREKFDVIFIDQLSASIPLLKWLTGTKILFYCHFPDKLLSRRDSILKKLYRVPFDKFEELTTGMADCIVVNSRFTAEVFRRSFPSIKQTPKVLYPGIHFDSYSKQVDVDDPAVRLLETPKKSIISINRFERKKEVSLAILAFTKLRDSNIITSEEFKNLRLVIAGGYDFRVQENVQYHRELDQLARDLGLSTFTISPGSTTDFPPKDIQVVFLCSFNESQRNFLLSQATCLVYTPSNEHFGIVPVESMYAGVPVIAVNSGGPTETVLNNVTGFLCEPIPDDFARSMALIISGKDYDGKAMGEQGRNHVLNKFSLKKFVETLDEFLTQLAQEQDSISFAWPMLILTLSFILLTIVTFISSLV